jgi:hypothetical protein
MARKTRSKKTRTPDQAAAAGALAFVNDTQPSKPGNGSELPKDKEEEELEKLLFGDLEGFKAGLKEHEQEYESEGEPEDAAIHRSHDAGAVQDIAALHDDQVRRITCGIADAG